jgi:glycosyltransferase involved in cell wall biosynthesis
MCQLIIGRWDVVHAVDFDSFVPALLIAKLKRRPIVYDIADFYADTIGFPILPGLSRKIVAKIDRALMKSAAVIILPDEARIAQVGLDTTKQHVVIVNNSPGQGILKTIARERVETKAFTVFYGGGIGKGRGLLEMCLAIRDLPDVQLVVKGPCSPGFEAELRKVCENADNIELDLKFVPYTEVITETINAHLLFALYDPADHNARFASPNKLFEAMMCEKPIVVSDGTSMADVVRKEKCGLVVPYGDVQAIREAIARLKSDPGLRQELAANGRRVYEEKYDWQIMEQRLLTLYRQICRKSTKN